jgi:tRNA(Ile)-lysidine synthase
LKELIARIGQYGAQHQLWAPEVRVVAAVSGGSDSVAMLLILHELASRGELVLAGLAHLNHQIRGAAAGGDAEFCRDLAARLGIAAFIGTADVPALAVRENASLEVAGRHARQRFFAEVVQSGKADRVAIAHTRDDQAETVLLRLTRGAGALGLAGMAPRRGPLVRPVLDATRGELRNFLSARAEAWREDATNLDLTNPRNFVRHQVLPNLRQINQQADAALARAADLLRIDADLLETLANAAFVQNVESASAREFSELRRDTVDAESMVVVIRAEGLAKLPPALATRVARYALETANPSRSYGLEEAQALCAFAAGGTADDLPGLDMERLAAKVVLSKREPGEVPTVVSFELKLSVPGTVEAPHQAWTITAEGPLTVPADIAEVNRGPGSVVVDASELGDQLIVRTRRPGDRLQPLGAPGRKKVQDVLVDRKVPRDDRDRVAIVTTQKGQIVWVAGQALAEPFRVTSLTKSVVVLTQRRR